MEVRVASVCYAYTHPRCALVAPWLGPAPAARSAVNVKDPIVQTKRSDLSLSQVHLTYIVGTNIRPPFQDH